MNRIPSYFIQSFPHWYRVEVFRRVLYIFLFINTLSLLPLAEQLWSYHGMAGTRWDFSVPTFSQLGTSLTNILSHPINDRFPFIYILFIVGQLIFLTLGIFRILPIISSIAIYFFTVNLNMKGSLMFTGGEVLMNLVLFYLIFIQRSEKKKSFGFKLSADENPTFSFLQNVFNNTFFIILLIQICILYFFSTLYKLLDENWVQGYAIQYISNVKDYSSYVLHSVFGDSHIMSAIAGYLILIYQGLFSVLVWSKKIKFPFLIFGVLFHLAIAFGMGIFTFGIMMCLVYIPFLEKEHIQKIRRLFRIKKSTGQNVSL